LLKIEKHFNKFKLKMKLYSDNVNGVLTTVPRVAAKLAG
jgi:hypothetical protein